MSIRTLLLLLVLAVWLPAVAGFALLAHSMYAREAEAAQQAVQRRAESINSLVERELDKRVVMATSLGASPSLGDGNLARFHAHAVAVTQDSGNWVILVERTRQTLNTLVPFDPDAQRARIPDAPFVTGAPDVFFSPRGPLTGKAVLAVFAPERTMAPPRYNVAVAFEPAVIQAVLDQQAVTEGVASVLNRDQIIMARSRDPQKWFGQAATGDIRRRMAQNDAGFARTVTLDGVPSLTYLTPWNRYRWSVVIALPEAALVRAAQRVTVQVVTAAVVLLFIGLALAVAAARRVAQGVVSLHESATALGRDSVPPPLVTGMREADAVGRALHDAGVRSQDATHTLERRVRDAVAQASDAQAKLLDSQKHEAIGRLTGGLAHDFNNLLQTISTALRVMDRTLPDPPPRRVLEAASRATGKAADLVRQMLAFGRVQPLRPVAVSLRDFLLQSQELASKALGERVQLSAAVAPDVPPLFVDPAQLELALLNLVFNARDAMPDGGTVTILARRATPDETASLAEGAYACVQVVDDGPGMDERTRARAFEPYYTTKPVGKGTGLGLPQVLAFARQSGGDARIDSALGAGTRVSLVLPAALEAPPREATSTAPGPATAASAGLRILMVEDDVLVASVVAPALENAGHTVVLADTADRALALLQNRADFDVLFTDVVMPGKMTGMDLVGWCRQHRPTLGAVVATGYTSQQSVPGVQVLRKPYSMDALDQALAEAARARAAAA